MADILAILPQRDFDPSEVALPWLVWTEAGHRVHFATETGEAADCDPVTLTGDGLPSVARSLRARPFARDAYARMVADPVYRKPLRWTDARAIDFGGLLFPGGHAPGMRSYCESAEVARLAREAFAAAMPVAAICHGVLPLARAGVLAGRRTTALTAMMENTAVVLTRRALPGHYRTYPQTVESEVRAAVGPTGAFARGPIVPRYADAGNPDAGFVVTDGAYLSARWPGDAWTLAVRLAAIL
ncbi:type 1 glutamine amidotransferase domain-containing protein [Sphingomonas sp. SUN039]|uniref:type 1 glutamine amidotransferase domain-containing protein n=1 Tax=Sphingomonas sp. SUN039 TaxID=2937787 RepID=UPI0021643521|nr:type 1 glutamine amidotransferase domain-containing protein [Sphingomonas sp. SUN039]UVO54058.1 type 1 glutamine amidotransferase domain-containing protein [Sphingomonas sp. SUN039]